MSARGKSTPLTKVLYVLSGECNLTLTRDSEINEYCRVRDGRESRSGVFSANKENGAEI